MTEKGNGTPHPPTREILAALVLHLFGEAEPLEDVAGLGLSLVRSDLLQALVDLQWKDNQSRKEAR